MLWALAIFGDLLSLIPGVNLFSTIFTATGMIVLSAGTKRSMMSGVGGLATGAVIIAELLPGLSMLPAWTVRMALSSTIDKVATAGTTELQKRKPPAA